MMRLRTIKLRKQLMAGILSLGILCSSFALGTGMAEAANGTWKHNAKGWWYESSDGTYIQSDWLLSGGKWYYFNAYGYMVTGWKQIDGKWYYFSSNGAMVTGWKQVGSKWYFFNSNGVMATGWKQVKGKWYYFAAGGAMTTGWKEIKGKRYLFESTGDMCIGWKDINGKKYYFDANGVMATGTVTIDGTAYIFDTSGALTEKTTEAPKTCNHKWATKQVYVETIHHPAETITEYTWSEEWDEAVYVKKVLCRKCKELYDNDDDYLANDTCHAPFQSVSVIDHYIHHEPEILEEHTSVVKKAWDEKVYKDVTYCTVCGVEK